MSEILAVLENRILELKADPCVGILFVRKSAKAILIAQDVLKNATDAWRNLTEEANMLTPAITKAAEVKSEAERRLTKQLMESEKVAKEHGYTLEYIRSIQSSKFSSSETRALESIQNAVDGISKSRDLIEKNRFALPNIQHVGSLVKVAESAVKLLIQKKRQEDDSDNDDDSDLQASSAISAGNLTSPSFSLLSNDRGEIERMTNIQLKAERNLRSTFDALVAMEKDYQYAKAYVPISTPRARRLLDSIKSKMEQAEAAVAIAEWRHQRLRGVAPPKFLASVKEATKRVELIEKAIDDLYTVSRDDEMRSKEKNFALGEDFLQGANFHDDAFETVRNHRRALRGLMPSLYDREKRLEQRKHKKSIGIVSEEEGFDDTFVVTGKHNENLLLKAESLPSPGNVDQENLESENFQQRLLEDANLAYQNLKLRIGQEEIRRERFKNQKKVAARRESEMLLKEKKQKEILSRKKEKSFERAKKNWKRLLRNMMDRVNRTIKRLRLAQRRILRIKRERNSMLNEDTNSYRRRAIENAATSVINSGFDAAWQKRGSLLTRERTLSAAIKSVRKDEWLDINTASNDVIANKFTAISHTVSLTLGVLDCTPKQAERLSLRQGNSHIYPEDFLAQMLNDTLNSAKDMFSQKYAIDISDIRLIPFRCNKGELPTLAQRKRFDGFILTSAISPAIDYFFKFDDKNARNSTVKDAHAKIYNNDKIQWIKSLRSLLRDMIKKKDCLLALGNGHILLASIFAKSGSVSQYVEQQELGISNQTMKTSETKSSWNSGYTISALSTFGESMLNTLSFDTSQKEEVVLLPYARDLYLGNVEALSTYFIPILTSSPIHNDRSVNHSRQSHETIDAMMCKTSNVLSFHAVPHIPAALLRERLVELKDDIEGQNTLKTSASAPLIPSRMELQVATHTATLANLILHFYFNVINGEDVFLMFSNEGSDEPAVSDSKNEKRSNGRASTTAIDGALNDNHNSIMIRSEQLINEAVADTIQKAASPGKLTKNFTSNMESGIVAEPTGHNPREMENNSFLSIKALSRNFFSLPDSPHATFSHYGTVPKIVSCGHASTLDSSSLVRKILSSNRNKNAFCDAIVVGIVPTKDKMLLVLPSHSLSKSTNISELADSSIGKYDKILQNRQATSANTYLSQKLDEKFASMENWIDDIYIDSERVLPGINREDIWSHDIDLIEYSKFRTQARSKYKRVAGNIMDVSHEGSSVLTLKEFIALIGKSVEECKFQVGEEGMKIMKKKIDLWITPILPEVYRRMGISLEDLILKELVAENSIPTKNLTITIASYDEYLLRTIREKQINWTYIRMLSKPMLLSKLGVRAYDHHNSFELQQYFRNVSQYADGICVSKEMLLDRPPNPNLKRPYIEIKNLKEAVHAMPVVVSSAKVSGLSVFVQTFLSDSLKLDEVYKGSPMMEYIYYLGLGIDGMICQNFEMASKARKKFIIELDELAQKVTVKSPRETFLEHRRNFIKNKVAASKLSPSQSTKTKKSEINPTAAAWKSRDKLREQRELSRRKNSPNAFDTITRKSKPFIATKTKQRSRGQPTRPMNAAPKFRSMSSNFNRDKKVYKQGISRIGKRNEFYKRRYKGKNRRAREEFWNVMLP